MLFIVVLFLLPALIVGAQLMLPQQLEFHSFVVAQVFAQLGASFPPFSPFLATLCAAEFSCNMHFALRCTCLFVFSLVMDKFDADSSSRFIINFVFAANTLQTCKLMLSASNFPEGETFTPPESLEFYAKLHGNQFVI